MKRIDNYSNTLEVVNLLNRLKAPPKRGAMLQNSVLFQNGKLIFKFFGKSPYNNNGEFNDKLEYKDLNKISTKYQIESFKEILGNSNLLNKTKNLK